MSSIRKIIVISAAVIGLLTGQAQAHINTSTSRYNEAVLSTSQKSWLSDLSFNRCPKSSLTGGKLGYALSHSFEITQSLDLSGFNDGSSTIVNYGTEPYGSTHQLRMMTGLTYHF